MATTGEHADSSTAAQVYFDLVARRRSARHFADRPVPEALIANMVRAATQAPTACNRQLWHFVVVTDDAVKDRMSRLGDSYSQSYLYDAPVIIAVFYDASMESRNPCHTAYISAGMAVYAMLLAAEAQGLGAIYLGGIMDPRGIAAAVEAPPHLENLGIICVGYRTDSPPAPHHRDLAEVMSRDRCGDVPKLCQPDVRPGEWSLEQLADFRDKILWYKGIAFDGMTLHVNPEARFSHKMQHVAHRLGMLIQQRDKPRVLDVLPYNGDLLIQLLASDGDAIGRLCAYELTAGVARYIETRLATMFSRADIEWAVNPDLQRMAIPLPDDSVDIIACFHRLGHFADPLPLLREMRRVLKPGGRIVTADSNAWYPHMYWYRRMWRGNYALGRNWNYGPERKFSPRQLRRLFRAAGLRVCDVTAIHPATVKAAEQASRLAGRAGLPQRETRLRVLADRLEVTRGFGRMWGETLVHELGKA